MKTKLRGLDWLTAGDGLNGVVELALSASSMVMWRVVLADASLSWTPGLDAVLDLTSAPDATVGDRLRALIAPMTAAAGTDGTWQDFDLEQPLDAPGTSRWLQFRARILGTGDRRALVGTVTDVTERHESRQALTDLAERYRLLVDLSPDAIGVHQNGIVVYANPAALRMLGAGSPDELVGRPITSIVHADSIPELQGRLLTLAGPGSASEPAEATMVRFDGTELAVESVSVLTVWEGRPAFQVILRDITAQRAAEAALRYQAALAHHVSDAIIGVAADSTVTSWNPAAEAVYGRPAAVAVGRPVSELVGADLHPALVVRAGGVVQATHYRPDGNALHVRVSAAEMAGGHVLVCADETARRRAEQFFTTVVASLAEGVVVISAADRIESVNPAARRILNLGETDTVGRSATNVVLHDEAGRRLSPDQLPAAMTRRTGEALHNQVVCVFRPDGGRVWLSLSCDPLPSPDGGPYAVVASFTDITERRAINERLAFEASHDPLTGLANRALVTEWLTAARGAGTTVVLFVDLDRFKVINDSLGHRVGDMVLRVVGERLRSAVRGSDLVGRLGGDEFVVGASLQEPADAQRIAGNLADALRDPVVVYGRRLHVNASVGIVVAAPGDPRTADELLGDADLAMYQAKTQGRGRHAFFDVELRERTQRRLQLDRDLRAAIGRDELWVAYQPVVALPGRQMVGAEALLRWSHPVHGNVPPVEFIPLAEDSGAIHEIGAYVLRETCQTLARWAGAGTGLHVAVNLSAVQLDDPNLTTMIRETLARSGMPASSLCLEITESMLMRDHVAATRQLNELRGIGIRLAIDDFGTGYSSLAQLRQLPLDTLKIDRSFVSGLGGSDDAEAIVSSIISMAHAVDLTVVAEGVETEQQLDVLERLGCDLAQGYYFGRPGRAVDVFR